MILVDTSVWIDHLHRGDAGLAAALDEGLVLLHPMVLGELACGSLRNRAAILRLLNQLVPAPQATHAEVLALIEHRALMGRGIGYIDAHLLAATALAGTARLWTRDRRLAAVAAELSMRFDEAR